MLKTEWYPDFSCHMALRPSHQVWQNNVLHVCEHTKYIVQEVRYVNDWKDFIVSWHYENRPVCKIYCCTERNICSFCSKEQFLSPFKRTPKDSCLCSAFHTLPGMEDLAKSWSNIEIRRNFNIWHQGFF